MQIVNHVGKLSLRLLVLVVLLLTLSGVLAHSWRAPSLDTIKLPPGFTINIYADNVKNAREMTLGTRGTLFVGSQTGNVYAVVDRDHDNKADAVLTIARGLNN